MTTIHYDTIAALIRGAEFQDANAAKARDAVDHLAAAIDALPQQHAELEPQRLAADKAAADAGRLAAEFRAIAERYCQENGWTMPAPKQAEPPVQNGAERSGTDQNGNGAEQPAAAALTTPDAPAKEADDGT